MEEIELRVKEGIDHSQGQSLNIEDFDLADSDREDYHNNVDILFVLDTTASMGVYIEKSIITIKKIIEKFNKMEFSIKFALCTYRDHPPQESSYVTQFTDLSSAKEIAKILCETNVEGGGDGPEAVMDGLREGLTQAKWRLGEDDSTKSKRFLFHICDAPPHGIEYGGYSTDKKWRIDGCPCGTKKEDIAKLLSEIEVDYHLVKANNSLDQMENLFKQTFGKQFCDTICIEQRNQQSSTTHKADSDFSMEEKMTNAAEFDETKEASCSNDMWNGIVDALSKKLG